MILGHQKQWQFLKKTAELKRIPHGFLFFGQERLGKKKIALEFIKLLNCDNLNNGKPCQACVSCLNIEKLQYPDLLFIQPLEKEIQISQIRELSQRLNLRPFQSSFKTAILDQAHLMNQEAQSALLKTLEEPKGNTVLILITEHPEMLVPTILSRVQKIRFNPIEKKEIENYLFEKGLSEEKIKIISLLSLGKPGLAVNFIKDAERLDLEKEKLSDLIKIIGPESDLASRFQYVKRIVGQNQDLLKEEKKEALKDSKSAFQPKLIEILEGWLRYFRNFLLLKIGAIPESETSPELRKVFEKYSVSKIKEIIKTVQNIRFLLSTTNINPKLALELIMLEL